MTAAVAVCGCGAAAADECLYAAGAILEPELGCPWPAGIQIVTVKSFAQVAEPGAAPIVGTASAPLIPEGGDVMVYGDGGVGKTTLCVDLAFHLAAGDAWLGMPVPAARRVLIVENEGPRPLFRRKLKRKLAGWAGSEIGDLMLILEQPWAQFTFSDEDCRRRLAGEIARFAIDVLIVGPVTSSGMFEAGTIQEVRTFVALVDDVRARSGRPIAIVLVHHENKGGKVSGAWEGVGDTLIHVQGQGHGKLRIYFQKARWASSVHATSLQLAWADGDGFARVDADPERPERVWDDIAVYVLEHGGVGWNEIDKAVAGQGNYKRRRRDEMLAEGVLLNSGAGRKFELWHRDDPARPTLDTGASEGGRTGDAPASGTGDGAETATASLRPYRSRDAVRDAVVSASPGDDSGAAA